MFFYGAIYGARFPLPAADSSGRAARPWACAPWHWDSWPSVRSSDGEGRRLEKGRTGEWWFSNLGIHDSHFLRFYLFKSIFRVTQMMWAVYLIVYIQYIYIYIIMHGTTIHKYPIWFWSIYHMIMLLYVIFIWYIDWYTVLRYLMMQHVRSKLSGNIL